MYFIKIKSEIIMSYGSHYYDKTRKHVNKRALFGLNELLITELLFKKLSLLLEVKWLEKNIFFQTWRMI